MLPIIFTGGLFINPIFSQYNPDEYFYSKKQFMGTYIKPFRGILLGMSYEYLFKPKHAINAKIGITNRDLMYEAFYYFKFIEDNQIHGFQVTNQSVASSPGVLSTLSYKYYISPLKKGGTFYINPGILYKTCKGKSQDFLFVADFKTIYRELYLKYGVFIITNKRFSADIYLGWGYRFMTQYDHKQFITKGNIIDNGPEKINFSMLTKYASVNFYWQLRTKPRTIQPKKNKNKTYERSIP